MPAKASLGSNPDRAFSAVPKEDHMQNSTRLLLLLILSLSLAPNALCQSTPSQLFLPATTYPSGGNGDVFPAVGDLNGDGKMDLVLANSCSSINSCSEGSVSVLLGNGDGVFQPAVNYPSGGQFPTSVPAIWPLLLVAGP